MATPLPETRESSSPSLVRSLTTWDSTLLTIGSIIGTGIFITTADMARVLPHAGLILVVWLAGGLLTLAGALTYGELGVLFPKAGGLYHFIKEAYGPFAGFLYGWTAFLVIMSGGNAAIAVAFGEYLGSFQPWFSTQHILFSMPLGSWTWTLSGGQVAAVFAILFFTVVNHFGLKEGAWAQNALTVIKIGSILGLIVLGLSTSARVTPDYSAATGPASGSLLAAFGVAMIAALWAYDGWYGLTCSAGEIRDPARSLPRGLIAGTVVVIALYMLVNLVYFRALPVSEMAGTPRIAETAVAALFGPGAAKLVSLAVLISTFGALSSTILYSSRLYLPMAEDGLFFRSLARIHPTYRTPVPSLWAQTVWSIVLTVSGTFSQLYTYVVFASVVFHAMTAAAVFILRKKMPDAPRPYRTWGYPVVPALFILACLLLIGNTLKESPLESLIGLGIVALGVPAYWLFRRQTSRPTL